MAMGKKPKRKMAKKQSKIQIAPSKVGSLTAIARRDGGLKKNGEISKAWARKKMANPRTAASTKKKINFFMNFNKG